MIRKINVGNFRDSLKRIMKEKGISAATLSKQTKIPKSTLSEWLQGGRQPTFDDAILRLAKFLKVTPEALLTGEEPETELFRQVLGGNDDGFIEVHNGIFRLKIEKFVGKKGGGEK